MSLPSACQRALGSVRQSLGGFLDLLAPVQCAGCARTAACAPEHAPILCAACAATLQPSREPLPGVLASWQHDDALQPAIHRAKYGGDPWVARRLGALFDARAHTVTRAADGVVPVPLHPTRLRERGYNQAVELARAFHRPVRWDLLARVRATPRQVGRDRSARMENVTGAFACPHPSEARGLSLVLVDDVATTGATLHACRQALLDAGARQVWSVVLARAEAGAQG